MPYTTNKQLRKNQCGFTFIELILYVSILTFMMGALMSFVLVIVQNSEKSATQQELGGVGRYLTERLKWETRNAADINAGTSNFGVNFATNSLAQLSLKNFTPALDPTIFSVSGGQLMVKQGASAAVALNTSDAKVTSLIFTNNTSGNSKTKNITFTLTVAEASARQEYSGTISFQSSTEVRSN